MSCDKFTMLEGNNDNFQTWQGLIGPHYTPHVTSEGLLYWTNNGRLSNPSAISIKGPAGQGLQITGIADTVEALPETQPAGSVWLVGTESPYDSYVFLAEWIYLGTLEVGPPGPEGPQGPEGEPGQDYVLTENDKNEIADIVIASAEIGSDPLETEAQTIRGAINELNDGKVDKEEGKGLSTNDYDNTEKGKVGTAVEDISDLKTKVGTATLETVNKNLSAAVNELNQNINAVAAITGDGTLTDFTATDLTGAANELKGEVGDLEADKADQVIISGVEASSTSTSAYTVGEYLILEGVLYRVTSAIAVSDTITAGTNVTVVTVGEELASLKDTLNTKADKTNVTSISLAGTNNTGNIIKKGVYFYNNSVLKCAIVDIPNTSVITPNNCEDVTAGGLNALKAQFSIASLSSYFPIMGRGDGEIAITIPVQGNFTAFTLSGTSEISVDIYGDLGGGNITCDFNASLSYIDKGRLYLRFIPRTSYSTYLSVAKTGIASFYGNILITMT